MGFLSGAAVNVDGCVCGVVFPFVFVDLCGGDVCVFEGCYVAVRCGVCDMHVLFGIY